jgi:hypothetical protein
VGIGFGLIARKISEEIKEWVGLIFEARKDDNRHGLLFTPAGDDSVPLDEERLILIKTDGNGKYIIVGTLTPSQGANPGEKIFFSRDWKPAPEASVVAKLSMLNSGDVILDNDTETTGEATGHFKKTIKGESTIIERKDRTYTNEANVTNTIKENETSTIEKDKTETTKGNHTQTTEGDKKKSIDGNENITVKKNYSLKVNGNCDLNVDGNINIISAKNIVINGLKIDLN